MRLILETWRGNRSADHEHKVEIHNPKCSDEVMGLLIDWKYYVNHQKKIVDQIWLWLAQHIHPAFIDPWVKPDPNMVISTPTDVLTLTIQKVHSCSKVMGSFFAVAKYGVYFSGIGLKFCVWHKEVFCIHNEKYLTCMIYRHAWVNIQIW